MILPLTCDDIIGMPKSRWTKKIIIELAKKNGCNDESISVLERLPKDDVIAICLIPSGVYLCGSKRFGNLRNHCKYYRVDYDFIKSLGGGCE